MRFLGVVLLFVALGQNTALARPPGPFDAGQVRLSLSSALGERKDERYVVVGLGVGYFVLDGLELGAELEHWFVGRPPVTRLSPQVRYVAHFLAPVSPYVGAFYRHWFIGDGQADIDTVGGRAGAFILVGRQAVLGLGAAYEQTLACRDADCSVLYPEAIIAAVF